MPGTIHLLFSPIYLILNVKQLFAVLRVECFCQSTWHCSFSTKCDQIRSIGAAKHTPNTGSNQIGSRPSVNLWAREKYFYEVVSRLEWALLTLSAIINVKVSPENTLCNHITIHARQHPFFILHLVRFSGVKSARPYTQKREREENLLSTALKSSISKAP